MQSKKNLSRSCSELFLTDGLIRNIYNAGTLKENIYREIYEFLSERISPSKYEKGEHLLEEPTSNVSTM